MTSVSINDLEVGKVYQLNSDRILLYVYDEQIGEGDYSIVSKIGFEFMVLANAGIIDHVVRCQVIGTEVPILGWMRFAITGSEKSRWFDEVIGVTESEGEV